MGGREGHGVGGTAVWPVCVEHSKRVGDPVGQSRRSPRDGGGQARKGLRRRGL